MQYLVRHRTVYDYPEKVAESQHLARLRPREDGGQRCWRHVLRIEPEPGTREDRVDAFGNGFTFFAQEVAHAVLWVEALSVASPAWEEVAEGLAEDAGVAHLEAQPFRFASGQVPVSEALAAYARPSFGRGRGLLEAVRDLTGRIFRDFCFDASATAVATPVEAVLRERRGVCQDFAHLEIACLRSLGLAARYVSGYLETLPPPGQARLVGADASHAWISVYCPSSGWVEFDPTNDCVAGPRHLRLAWGRDYGDVSPLRGVTLGGGEQPPRVMVDVTAHGSREEALAAALLIEGAWGERPGSRERARG